jgi:hypothetical protein
MAIPNGRRSSRLHAKFGALHLRYLGPQPLGDLLRGDFEIAFRLFLLAGKSRNFARARILAVQRECRSPL